MFVTFPLRAHVPFFKISYYPLVIIFVCSFLLFHPWCSHARGILCRIHTSCMGSPFPIVHTKLSLLFRSLAPSSQPLSTALSLLYNNNNNACVYVCVCIYIYIYIYVNIHLYTHTYSDLHTHTSIHAHTNTYTPTNCEFLPPEHWSRTRAATAPLPAPATAATWVLATSAPTLQRGTGPGCCF